MCTRVDELRGRLSFNFLKFFFKKGTVASLDIESGKKGKGKKVCAQDGFSDFRRRRTLL